MSPTVSGWEWDYSCVYVQTHSETISSDYKPDVSLCLLPEQWRTVVEGTSYEARARPFSLSFNITHVGKPLDLGAKCGENKDVVKMTTDRVEEKYEKSKSEYIIIIHVTVFILNTDILKYIPDIVTSHLLIKKTFFKY